MTRDILANSLNTLLYILIGLILIAFGDSNLREANAQSASDISVEWAFFEDHTYYLLNAYRENPTTPVRHLRIDSLDGSYKIEDGRQSEYADFIQFIGLEGRTVIRFKQALYSGSDLEFSAELTNNDWVQFINVLGRKHVISFLNEANERVKIKPVHSSLQAVYNDPSFKTYYRESAWAMEWSLGARETVPPIFPHLKTSFLFRVDLTYPGQLNPILDHRLSFEEGMIDSGSVIYENHGRFPAVLEWSENAFSDSLFTLETPSRVEIVSNGRGNIKMTFKGEAFTSESTDSAAVYFSYKRSPVDEKRVQIGLSVVPQDDLLFGLLEGDNGILPYAAIILVALLVLATLNSLMGKRNKRMNSQESNAPDSDNIQDSDAVAVRQVTSVTEPQDKPDGESYYANKPQNSSRQGWWSNLFGGKKTNKKTESINKKKLIQFYHDVLRIVRDSEGYKGEESRGEILTYLERALGQPNEIDQEIDETVNRDQTPNEENENRYIAKQIADLIKKFGLETPPEDLGYPDVLAWVVEQVVEQRELSWQVLEEANPSFSADKNSYDFVNTLKRWRDSFYEYIKRLKDEIKQLKHEIENLKAKISELIREKGNLIKQNEKLVRDESSLQSKISTIVDVLTPIRSDLDISREQLTMGNVNSKLLEDYSRVAVKGTIPELVYQFQYFLNSLEGSVSNALKHTPYQSPFNELLRNILEGKSGNRGLVSLKASLADISDFKSKPVSFLSNNQRNVRVELWDKAKEKEFVFMLQQISRLYMYASIPHQIGSVDTDMLFRNYETDRELLKEPFGQLKFGVKEFFDLDLSIVSLFRDKFHDSIHETSTRNYTTLLSILPDLKNQLYTLESRTITDIDSVGLKSGIPELGLNIKPHVYFTS